MFAAKILLAITILLLPFEIKTVIFSANFPPDPFSTIFLHLSSLTLLGSGFVWGFCRQKTVTLRSSWFLPLILIALLGGELAALGALHPLLAWWGWSQLLALILFIYLWRQPILTSDTKWGLVASTLTVEAVIILLQTLHQGALGLGLGEPTFTATTVGTAKWWLGNWPLARAYGTLAHPNVAAAFMAIGCLLVAPKIPRLPRLVPLLWAVALIGTWSRAAIILTALLAVYEYWPHLRWSKIIMTLGGALLLLWPWLIRDPASWNERVLYANIAWESVLQTPGGVGSQHFTLHMEPLSPQPLANWQHQPPHNIWLLLASEQGLVSALAWGLIFLLILISETPRSATQTALLFILGTSLLDHYWITNLPALLLAGLVLADSHQFVNFRSTRSSVKHSKMSPS